MMAFLKVYNPGAPLWLSGKVVKNEKINEIERTRVRSPPRATSFFKKKFSIPMGRFYLLLHITITICNSLISLPMLVVVLILA
jgi:hypothetical protein